MQCMCADIMPNVNVYALREKKSPSEIIVFQHWLMNQLRQIREGNLPKSLQLSIEMIVSIASLQLNGLNNELKVYCQLYHRSKYTVSIDETNPSLHQ